jgi:hypothetical protein
MTNDYSEEDSISPTTMVRVFSPPLEKSLLVECYEALNDIEHRMRQPCRAKGRAELLMKVLELRMKIDDEMGW